LPRLLTRKQLLGWVGKVSAGILASRMASGWIASYASEDWSHLRTDARFVWPTVPGNLSGLQSFRAGVRKRGKGDDPTARVELYVAGVHRATVVPDTPVTRTSGEYLEGTWDAAALGITSSADVEMAVVSKGARGGMVEIADWNNTTMPHQWVAR
jgi:hypothetical protein